MLGCTSCPPASTTAPPTMECAGCTMVMWFARDGTDAASQSNAVVVWRHLCPSRWPASGSTVQNSSPTTSLASGVTTVPTIVPGSLASVRRTGKAFAVPPHVVVSPTRLLSTFLAEPEISHDTLKSWPVAACARCYRGEGNLRASRSASRSVSTPRAASAPHPSPRPVVPRGFVTSASAVVLWSTQPSRNASNCRLAGHVDVTTTGLRTREGTSMAESSVVERPRWPTISGCRGTHGTASWWTCARRTGRNIMIFGWNLGMVVSTCAAGPRFVATSADSWRCTTTRTDVHWNRSVSTSTRTRSPPRASWARGGSTPSRWLRGPRRSRSTESYCSPARVSVARPRRRFGNDLCARAANIRGVVWVQCTVQLQTFVCSTIKVRISFRWCNFSRFKRNRRAVQPYEPAAQFQT